MKLKSLGIAVCFLTILSCNKQDTDLPAGLNGTWELLSTDGGWSGHHDYPSGNGNTIAFDGHKYSQKIKAIDTTYLSSGTFKIYTGKPCDLAKEETVISFDSSDIASGFSRSGNQITFTSTECLVDGGSSTYKKIQ